MRKILNFIRGIKESPLESSIVLLLIFIVGCINSFVEIVVFSNELLNLMSFLCILAIPLMIIINGFRFPKLWMKICNFLFFAIPAVISRLFAFLYVIIIHDVGLPYQEHERTQKLETKNYIFSIYKFRHLSLIDKGNYGCIARQEKEILPKILLVRRFSVFYFCTGESYRVVGEDDLIVNYIHSGGMTSPIRYKLKKFVYF